MLPDAEMSSSYEKLCLVLVVFPLLLPPAHVTLALAVPPAPMNHDRGWLSS